jgi:hypothetical protein
MSEGFASDRFTPVLGDRRGVARRGFSDEADIVLRWWRPHASKSPRLAQWLNDACDDGFTRLHAYGINAVDWWLDVKRLGPRQARRRYSLDADSELEWLLQRWPPQLRMSEDGSSSLGYLFAVPGVSA